MHKEEFPISQLPVKKQIHEKVPHFSSLPLTFFSSEIDNTLFRLGDRLLVRLPKIYWAANSIPKESAWLAKLAPFLPWKIPTIVYEGSLSKDYPWRWGIYSWMEGETPVVGHSPNELAFAKDLAFFLKKMWRIPLRHGPISPRGAPLAWQDSAVENSLKLLEGACDASELRKLWKTACALPNWDKAPVCVHGDCRLAIY